MPGKFALIIGNCTYQAAGLGQLNAPAQDVRALADALLDPEIGGFNDVKTLIDRPYADLQREIVTFFDGRAPDDTLLLYFSGHGLLDESGRLFLASSETTPDRPRALSIPAALIADEMGSSRSRRQVLILDCCHSGAYLVQHAKGGQPVRPVNTGDIFRGSGRTVLTASDTTEFAFEGEARSIFTQALVEGLRTGEADQDGDSLISVHEWYDYAYEQVTQANPRQTPMKANYGMRGKVYIARAPAARSANPAPSGAAPADDPGYPARPRFKTWLVHPYGRGDFFTISEAIQAAAQGDRIEVSPGVYEETLVIKKPLEIVGLGGLGDVTVQVANARVIDFNAPGGRLENLELRQLGGKYYCVGIAGGRLELERCDISSQGDTPLVGIYNGARPIVHSNQIHDGKSGGIIVYEKGQGLIENNDIYGNGLAGIAIQTGGNPTVRGNQIHDGKAGGVHVYEKGQGLIENNDIYGNGRVGIAIQTGGNPTVRGNQIHDGKAGGIGIRVNGQGLFEENHIYRNAAYGVSVYKKSGGTFKRNVLDENKRGSWYISDDSKPLVVREGNQET